MAFPSQVVRIPTEIGDIWHIVKDAASGPDSVQYVYQVLDQFGVVMRIEDGDELPHISNGPLVFDLDNLIAFAARQRAKAEATLPPPE